MREPGRVHPGPRRGPAGGLCAAQTESRVHQLLGVVARRPLGRVVRTARRRRRGGSSVEPPQCSGSPAMKPPRG